MVKNPSYSPGLLFSECAIGFREWDGILSSSDLLQSSDLLKLYPSALISPMLEASGEVENFQSLGPTVKNIFFSRIGYYRILNRIPCVIQYVLISNLFYICSNVYMLIPNS